MRTAIYARVSTEEQAKEGFSIPAQREKLTSYAMSQDWDIVGYYIDEGISAKDTNRPELQRMITNIKRGEIDVVLVYKLDRLTRSVLDLYNLLETFDKYGAKFKSATEVYDTTTAIGRLFITLVAALAQWERENLAERVRFGMEQMAKEGKRPGGVTPFGYNKDFSINESEAIIVKEIFRLYIGGWGIQKITKHLNRLSGKSWSANTVWYLLKNPAYAGDLRWGYSSGTETLEKDTFTPIIDRNTFGQTQKIMDSRAAVHPRQATSPFLFSGKVFCGKCGSSFVGKKAGAKKYKYYYCTKKLAGSCDSKSIRESELEEQFLAYSKSIIDAQVAFEESTATSEEVDHSKTIERMNAELDKIRDRRKKWQYAWAENMLSDEDYKARIEEERQREQDILKAIEDLQGSSTRFSQEEIYNLLLDIQTTWIELTEENKKSIVQPMDIRFLVNSTDSGVKVTFE